MGFSGSNQRQLFWLDERLDERLDSTRLKLVHVNNVALTYSQVECSA